jgi:hypothetical protein
LASSPCSKINSPGESLRNQFDIQMDKHLTYSYIIYQVYKKNWIQSYSIKLSGQDQITSYHPIGRQAGTLIMFDPCWSTVSLVLWPNLSTLVSVPEQASNSRPESADASSVWYFTSGANSDEHVHVRCVYQQLGTWSRSSHPFLPRCTATSLEGAQSHDILGDREIMGNRNKSRVSTYVHLCPPISTCQGTEPDFQEHCSISMHLLACVCISMLSYLYCQNGI